MPKPPAALGAGTIWVISFDVFLQAFHDGDAATADPARVLQGLARFSIEPVTPDSSWIRTIDGGPACVTRAELLDHLPAELNADTRVVTTGDQLVAAFN